MSMYRVVCLSIQQNGKVQRVEMFAMMRMDLGLASSVLNFCRACFRSTLAGIRLANQRHPSWFLPQIYDQFHSLLPITTTRALFIMMQNYIKTLHDIH